MAEETLPTNGSRKMKASITQLLLLTSERSYIALLVLRMSILSKSSEIHSNTAELPSEKDKPQNLNNP